ncbi:hypothetical protein H3Z83_01525 [Tenacibaculum sp. S7007]|uniref:Uncharacterized protein n=1 Tax=Tenacibaculum pelagium TaxID=2759527 RepID=A0A839ALD9_9FLAO|nr:hypothetical protein [Tenacibaculum pelagium]MBA6155206.1 hypothetical protein [Tenacibaculum pelagium]
MILKEIVYAPTAVKQLIYKFNNENLTKIEFIETEIMDGTPFVTMDFKDTPAELIYKFAYKLGSLQKYLAMKGDSWLPLDQYPFPPES